MYGGNSLGFLGAQFKMLERFKHPIELNKVEQSGNVGYVEKLWRRYVSGLAMEKYFRRE